MSSEGFPAWRRGPRVADVTGEDDGVPPTAPGPSVDAGFRGRDERVSPEVVPWPTAAVWS